MKKIKKMASRGFTLVELLIVIALISILAVAVLATINPIEQANKARDATVQNDAAEVLNAYERYYTNGQDYPWMEYGEATPITVDDAVLYRSDHAGFGICYRDIADVSTEVGSCNTSGSDLGMLIEADELKQAFAGKDEFSGMGTSYEEGLFTLKMSSSGGSIYVCYVPKAKSNRQQADKLYCIYDSDGAFGMTGTKELVKAGSSSGGRACVALASTSSAWDTPVFNGLSGMYRCVPE